MSRPEVAVFGEWNTANLGDRAIHRNVLRFCAECGCRASSYAIGSLSPVAPETMDRRPAPPGKGRALVGGAPRLKSVLRGFRQRGRMRALMPQLERADAIIVGGGELLSDRNLHFPQSLAVLADAARRLGKPMFCLGCSAEGSWSPRAERMITKFLASCDLVATRDDVTAERLSRVLGREIAVFGDFCLANTRATDTGNARSRHILAINALRLPPALREAQESYEAAIVDLVKRVIPIAEANHAHAVRVFTTGTVGDIAPAQRVLAGLQHNSATLVAADGLNQLYELLDMSALVVAGRLHAGILALDRGSAVVGVSPSPKLRRFFSSFGLGDYGFDIDATDQLVACIEATDFAAIAAGQHERILHLPNLACLTQVREALGSLAGGAAA